MRLLKIVLGLIAVILLLIVIIPVGYITLPNERALNIKPTANLQGIGAYFINLDRSPERLKYISNYVEKLNLPTQRISAIDGAKLSANEIAQTFDAQAYKKFLGYVLRPGVIGCALSHIKTWETFLASDYEFAIIFEDDVSFDAQQVRMAIDNLMQNQNYWDIATLNTGLRGTPLTLKKFANGTRMVVYLSRIHQTGAYIINRYAAKKLLSKALPIKLPVDLYFNRSWELDLKFVGIEPRIAKQTFGDSTIEDGTGNDYYPDLKFNVSRRLFIIQTNIVRFVYNLWTFIKLKF